MTVSPPTETVKHYYRVDSREISFLRFVLEGYDGLAVLTTIDADSGNVVIFTAPGCEGDIAGVVGKLRNEMLIESMPGPEASGGTGKIEKKGCG